MAGFTYLGLGLLTIVAGLRNFDALPEGGLLRSRA